MAKISKFVKLDKDVLLEYVYNDGNVFNDRYRLLVDSRTQKRSYMAADTSSTGNTLSNQIVGIDLVDNRFGKVDPTFYTYLQLSDYSSSLPLRHDILKFHIPVNWTFGEHVGFYVRISAFDSTNSLSYNISNFYFDMTDTGQQSLMDYNTPALLFQEKLWGKSISFEIPSVSGIAAQLANGVARPNSLNYNLTGGLGLSSTSPIMIEFFFIEGSRTINNVKTFTVGQKYATSVPQTPEFETLGLTVKHSDNGDFFEIFGTYNGNSTEFNKFINDSLTIGRKFYVQYDITTYEQNVRGKTTTVTVMDNFNETIDYRPIIKVSTTTAILDVEMRLIDMVDDSYIVRRASYGMLQDEVSKYSSNMTKLDMSTAMKPKIYNIKNNIDASLLGKTNSMGIPLGTRGRTGKGFNVGIGTKKGIGPGGNMNNPNLGSGGTGVTTNVVKIPYAVLVEVNNVVGKSENQYVNKDLFYGINKMSILIYPFDNVLRFTIATGDAGAPTYLDMSNLGEISLVFKSDAVVERFGLMQDATDLNVSQGQLVFRIPEVKINSLKSIFNDKKNVFYITAKQVTGEVVLYSGLFQINDNAKYIDALNQQSAGNTPKLNQDPNLPKETAIVYKKQTTLGTNPNPKP